MYAGMLVVNPPCRLQMSPETSSSEDFISLTVLRARLRISSARLRRNTPSSVSVTFLFPLTRSTLPSSCSKSASCLESVGCVRCRNSAALVKFCSLATARKYSSTRSSISPSFHDAGSAADSRQRQIVIMLKKHHTLFSISI